MNTRRSVKAAMTTVVVRQLVSGKVNPVASPSRRTAHADTPVTPSPPPTSAEAVIKSERRQTDQIENTLVEKSVIVKEKKSKSQGKRKRDWLQAADSNSDYDVEVVLCKARECSPTRSNWRICEAMEHLCAVDERFKRVICKYELPTIFTRETEIYDLSKAPIPNQKNNQSHFHKLLQIIVYQQLSAKSAEPIFNRLLGALGVDTSDASSDGNVTPQHLLRATMQPVLVEGKKKILVNGQVSGLSESKATYCWALAEHFSDPARLGGDVDLSKLSDEELYEKLVAVKGLGPWSVQMFMMFELHRPNVLPVGDLGVRRGLCVFWGLPLDHFESAKRQRELPALCEAWQPYWSAASFYMWRLSEDRAL